MTEDDKAQLLTQERDKIQAKLDEIRVLRMQLSLKTRDDRRAYLIKLGELSFVVGAAITPILIVSNNNISFKAFAISGVAIYLAGGLLAMWECKTLIYSGGSYRLRYDGDFAAEAKPRRLCHLWQANQQKNPLFI